MATTLGAGWEELKTMTLPEERRRNQRAYRRLKKQIDETYPAGQYVAIVRDKIVADAPDFRQLMVKTEPIERDPDRRFVIQAGVDYPQEMIVL
jgi:23S rRNA-/tRNA-specific pseudouridylate synthase